MTTNISAFTIFLAGLVPQTLPHYLHNVIFLKWIFLLPFKPAFCTHIPCPRQRKEGLGFFYCLLKKKIQCREEKVLPSSKNSWNHRKADQHSVYEKVQASVKQNLNQWDTTSIQEKNCRLKAWWKFLFPKIIGSFVTEKKERKVTLHINEVEESSGYLPWQGNGN